MSVNAAMYVGTTGLSSFSTAMRVVSDNIANANTTAFKSNTVRFGDMVSGYLPSTTGDNDRMGAGVSILGSVENFEQGSLIGSSAWSNVAIDGDGFFQVSKTWDGENTNQTYYTRDGSFHMNENGYLVNSSGYNVLNTDGNPMKLLEFPDNPEYNNFNIDESGQVYGTRIRTIELDQGAQTIGKTGTATVADSTLVQGPGKGDTVYYSLTGEADSATIKVYDKNNNIVKTVTIPGPMNPATHPDPYAWTWDGTDQSGSPLAPNEPYHYTIETQGNVEKYDYTNMVINDPSTTNTLTLPVTLSGPADSITLTISNGGNSYTKTISTDANGATFSAAGNYLINWDGTEGTGTTPLTGTCTITGVTTTAAGVSVGPATGALVNQEDISKSEDNVSYLLNEDSYVSLLIYNSDGELVRTVYEGEQSANTQYNLNIWGGGLGVNGEELPAGIYNIELRTAPASGSVGSPIDYTLLTDADVTIKVYDKDSKLVSSQTVEGMNAGQHSWSWNGMTDSGIPAADGTYTYELTTSKDYKSEAITDAKLQVVLFPNKDGLVRHGGNMFSIGTTSGDPITAGDSWEKTIGKVVGYNLESSNVDIAKEMVNMIVYQATYNANSKSITTASDMLNTAVNLIR